MTAQEQFLSKRKRYQPIALPQHFSDEEMARDWTIDAVIGFERTGGGKKEKVVLPCAKKRFQRTMSQRRNDPWTR